MRVSVLLPAPFSPSSASTSPASTDRSIASLASSDPNRLVIPRSSTSGAPRGGESSPPRAASAGVTPRPWWSRPARPRSTGVVKLPSLIAASFSSTFETRSAGISKAVSVLIGASELPPFFMKEYSARFCAS